jgi:hypothetical protein
MFPFRILPAALFAVYAAASPAFAQPYPAYRVYPEPPRYQPAIPPHEVSAIVRSLGLMPTSGPRPRGPFWVVDAVGQDGSPVRVRIDAMSGRVAEIVRVPGPRMVRVYPGGPPPGPVYDAPPANGYGIVRGPAINQPGYYEDNDDDYPLKDGPGYGPQGSPNYYGGPRGSIQPAPSGPQVITRGGDVTNSVPPRQASRVPGNDPLIGVPREFRGEQKPKAKAETKKTAAKPEEKTPTAAPLPKPRPADAPAVAKTDTKPAETAPAVAVKKETVKPAPSKPGAPPVQGLE